MVETLLVNNIWLTIVVWTCIYLSDYYVTIYTARLYQTDAKEHFSFGGSFELTPQFQEDVNHLRLLSPRFLQAVIFSNIVLIAFWWLATQWLGLPLIFSLLIGALILREAAIHIRHVRNIILFRSAQKGGSLQGRIEYSRPLVLKLSATELFAFAVLFFVMFLVSGGWFFLGGTLSCTVTGWQHWALAKKARLIGRQV